MSQKNKTPPLISQERAFAECFSTFSPPPTDSQFADLKSRFAKAVQNTFRVRRQIRTSSIHIDFSDRQTLNAAAAHRHGHDLIAINVGTVLNLTVLYESLLSHPSIFAHVGDSRNETAPFDKMVGCDWTAPLEQICALLCPRGEDWSAIQPADPVRESCAQRLFHITMMFLFYHELPHIILGHIDFLKKATGDSLLTELGSVRSNPSASRRCLEMDADIFAAEKTFGVMFVSRDKPGNPFRDMNLTERLTLWGVSLLSLFTVFGQGKRSALEDYVDATHPHPLIRFMYVFGALKEYCQHDGTLECAKRAWHNAISEVGNAWIMLGMGSATFTECEYDQSLAYKQYKEVLRDWAKLKPTVRACCRVET